MVQQKYQILLGQYRPIDSFLHRLDVRIKLILVILVFILALFTKSLLFSSTITVLSVFALLYSGINIKVLFRNLIPLLIFIIITLIYHLLWGDKTGDVLITIWNIDLTEQNLSTAAFYSLRLILFFTSAFVVTLTSSPADLADGVSQLLKYSKWFKVPIQEIRMIVFIAIRFIPILYDEFHAIKNAQKMRGINWDGTRREKIQRLTSLIIPIFISTLNRADELALAIQARGYQPGVDRTSYGQKQIKLSDGLFLLVISVIFLFLFWKL